MNLYFTHTFSLARLTNDAGTTAKEAYGSVLSTFQGALMNTNPADAMLGEGNPSKSSSVFCDASVDILDTDKLTCDGVSYIVKGVALVSGVGSISYKKALVEKLNS